MFLPVAAAGNTVADAATAALPGLATYCGHTHADYLYMFVACTTAGIAAAVASGLLLLCCCGGGTGERESIKHCVEVAWPQAEDSISND